MGLGPLAAVMFALLPATCRVDHCPAVSGPRVECLLILCYESAEVECREIAMNGGGEKAGAGREWSKARATRNKKGKRVSS